MVKQVQIRKTPRSSQRRDEAVRQVFYDPALRAARKARERARGTK